MTDEQASTFAAEVLKRMDPIAAAEAAGFSPRKIYGAFCDERVKKHIKDASDYEAFFLRVLLDESAAVRDRMHAAEVLAKVRSEKDTEVRIEIEYV